MNQVAIYVRVSTKGQELDNQLLQLRKYAEKSEWKTYKEYCDIISGKETSRPAFNELFNDAHKKLFDIVLFWDISRFSRSGTLFTLQKFNELEGLGIKWHSYQDKYFSTTLGDFKDVVISIMATLAKIEREKISERTKAGLARTNKKLGRPSIPKEAELQVVSYLQQPNPPSYRKISELVTYKTKFGKVHNVSIAQITRIKQSLLQKGV